MRKVKGCEGIGSSLNIRKKGESTMLRNIRPQMCSHPKNLAKMLQEFVDRIADLEAVQTRPVKDARLKVEKQHADREAKAAIKRHALQEKADAKAAEDKAIAKAEAEEDALATADDERLAGIQRSRERATARAEGQGAATEDGEKEGSQ